MRKITNGIGLALLLAAAFAVNAAGQEIVRDLKIKSGGTIEIVNRSGRVFVSASDNADSDAVIVRATTASESDIKIDAAGGRARVETVSSDTRKRIDLSITVPPRTRVRAETLDGEVRVSGDLESAEVTTETGTIAADVPTDDVRYDLVWTSSRPRYVSDLTLEEVKEKSGGKFGIKGRHRDENEAEQSTQSGEDEAAAATDGTAGTNGTNGEPEKKKKDKKQTGISLNFTTARGIVLLNVPPNEVMSDLRERPLTNAAKAIVRSGDRVLTDAIRRASPKYFGEYAKTLPPAMRTPSFAEHRTISDGPAAPLKQATVRVTDAANRAIAGLRPEDFTVAENGELREIVSVTPVTAPVNMVLLLDVSGSVDNYVDFIRKAARNFINTVDANDRLSIVIFNDDVKVLSGFSTDKQRLSDSLDTFDAGGPTAYYDALAFTLAESLRPLRGERTAIVVLTDGDDNRSFLPFDSLTGAIEESGALIYPLYVPSSLIAAASANPEATVDPVRSRYTGLTQKAEGEGEKLAKISGGVYYPISQISQIQKAYEDIAQQLRTAYGVTYRSTLPADSANRPSPRLKIRTKRQNAFVTVNSVVPVIK